MCFNASDSVGSSKITEKNVKNQLEGFGFGAYQVYVLLSVSMHSAAGDVDFSFN